ncbi:MAG: hypothetical protein AAF498_16580 [Pseudomonadota bacterium]
MSRFWLLSLVLLASCASADKPDTRILYPDGRIIVPASSDVSFDEVTIASSELVGEVSDIDAALETYLSPRGDGLILLPNRLDKAQLDYSMESLKEIDRWLADIHTVNKLEADLGSAGESLMRDGRGDNSVMFAGLYLGEVIRANSSLTWNWERFDRFLNANPVFAEHYGTDPGFDTFVLVGPQGVATPINTALKRVVQGREESVHYIGSLLLNEIDLEKALSGQNLMGLDRRRPGE